MEKRLYPALDEQLYTEKLNNGLQVFVIPKPGFTRKIAYFLTDFGSIHTEFTLDGKAYSVPAGIAHFLEHKMFDLPDRDVSAEFAALGASPNAFTSYDMTAYHFSCTENFDKSLRLLLEFVSTPYFTEESVQKEQGIIGQEIGMYEDNPEARGFELLVQDLYRQHPIKTPILGTRESIAQITPEHLYACHKAFYRPHNILLCVIGDVDPEQVKKIALETLPETQPVTVTCQRAWQEEMTHINPLTTQNMEVAMPVFQLGFKCEPAGKGEGAILQEIVGELAAEVLVGEASPLYKTLYEEGVIDGSFAGGFETVEGMAMLVFSGDSEAPEKVREALFREAERLAREGIDETEFLRLKRGAIGRRIRDLDSFSSTIFRVCAYYLTDFDYFCIPGIYQQVTAAHILEFLKKTICRERCAMSIIYPKEETQ